MGKDRLYAKKWGIFNHLLYNSEKGYTEIADQAREWNEQIDSFDAAALAQRLHKIGAGYYFITIMQGSRFMIAPNETYTRITGIAPGEGCARRDLIMDIALALKEYDIDLYLYYTGDGPHFDEVAGPRMGLKDTPEVRHNVTESFVCNWASVLEEYAVRYGDLVKGWWIDGCYADIGYNQQLLSYYYRAVKKGNPDCALALNCGVRDVPEKWFEHEDFTCGEDVDFTHIFSSRFTDGAQNHLLIPLGVSPDGNTWNSWRKRGLKRSKEYVADFVAKNYRAGGVISIDIFVDQHGNWDDEQIEALCYVGEKMK